MPFSPSWHTVLTWTVNCFMLLFTGLWLLKVMLLRHLVKHLPPLRFPWDGGSSVVEQHCFKDSYNITTKCLHGAAVYSSSSHDTILLLRNSDFHYLIHSYTPLVPLLNLMDPVHVLSSNFISIPFNIILLPTPRPSSGLFPSVSPPEFRTHFSSP